MNYEILENCFFILILCHNNTMKKRTHWAWKIYLVIYSLIALLDLMVLFSQGSPISEYYRVLIAFKTRYYVPYYFYIAKIFV